MPEVRWQRALTQMTKDPLLPKAAHVRSVTAIQKALAMRTLIVYERKRLAKSGVVHRVDVRAHCQGEDNEHQKAGEGRARDSADDCPTAR